ESLQVIRLLWETEGPVDFTGRFYRLHQARLDTEPFDGKFPEIWIAGSGPRMLDLAGRYGDGWWPVGAYTPEEYAAKLAVIRRSADRAGRDPLAIVPAFIITCLIGDDDELAEIVAAPLVKAHVMMIPAADMAERGFEHPLGPDWQGFQDINPAALPRERI